MQFTLVTVGLLICSNVFMTFAWYAHLQDLKTRPWIIAVLVSWGIAFFEYILQVPANRIGATSAGLNLAQLKVIQEVITLAVFAPFAIFYMRFKLDYNFMIAGLCMVAAVFFVMRSKPAEGTKPVAAVVESVEGGK
ncbi:MAG: DMT family protein [Tepidisphaeraceae bacterium]